MPDIINRTASRAAALARVIRKEIMYQPSTGEFVVMQGTRVVPIAGSERRTFADLRAGGLITFVENGEKQVLIQLTDMGSNIADQWGLTSQ